MSKLALIAASGALGTLCRYGVGVWTHRLFDGDFPLGTLLVNLVGCLLLGLMMYLSLSAEVVQRQIYMALSVGFLGAFTTYSTFAYDTVRYLGQGDLSRAVMNVMANLVLGCLAVLLGFALARALLANG